MQCDIEQPALTHLGDQGQPADLRAFAESVADQVQRSRAFRDQDLAPGQESHPPRVVKTRDQRTNDKIMRLRLYHRIISTGDQRYDQGGGDDCGGE